MSSGVANTRSEAQTFYCIVTCDCGCTQFRREVDEAYAQAFLKCAECSTVYRQPAVRYTPLRVTR